ncbi:hypothetical protein Zmor_006397 [Zophobas morio]|uniref:Core-binding (CB) domain-containing protein n=1 Tax=Zophobas morio TaxID=2755281 RepID=A0AA38IVZ8_9CUCU|nr:hypothetical protein Zmor_006397 [Zophobas morio]
MQDSNEIMENLLPEKSRDVYKKVCQKFLRWKEQQGIGEITEMVILNYLQDQSKNAAPSSMWNYCSMIKACLIAFENIDIGRFPKVKALLKQKSRGYRSKKSKVLDREEVLRFVIEAPDEVYLLVKMILVVEIARAPMSDTNIVSADNPADGFRTIVNNTTTGSTMAKFEPGSIQNCNIFLLDNALIRDLRNLMR